MGESMIGAVGREQKDSDKRGQSAFQTKRSHWAANKQSARFWKGYSSRGFLEKLLSVNHYEQPRLVGI
jgi:hypothetical protein